MGLGEKEAEKSTGGLDRTVSRAQRQQGELGLGGEGAPPQSLKGMRCLSGP